MAFHSPFPPSSAHRWVVCQQSLVPPKLPLNDENQYATDGSAKHALAKWAFDYGKDPVDALINEEKVSGFDITLDMVEAASFYTDYVRNLIRLSGGAYEFWSENRVFMPEIHPEMSGTLDSSIYQFTRRHLIVIDAKFGWEKIEADGNWQMRSYGIGKTGEIEARGGKVSSVTCVIIQPMDEHKPVKTVEYHRDELADYADVMRKALTRNDIEPGPHCHRCKRAHECAALDSYVNKYMSEVLYETDPKRIYRELIEEQARELTPEEIGNILSREESFKWWFTAVSQNAKKLLLSKIPVPGKKLKPSYTNREYIDKCEAENILWMHYGDAIYDPRELKGPAGIERLDPAAKKMLRTGAGITHRRFKGYTLVDDKEKP